MFSFLPVRFHARALAACLNLALVLSACLPASTPAAATAQPDLSQALALQSSAATRAAVSASAEASQTLPAAPTPQDTQPAPDETSTPTAAPTAAIETPTPAAVTVYLPDTLPAALRESLVLPQEVKIAAHPGQATLALDVLAEGSPAAQSVDWIYALAAPFPTLADAITLEELRAAWQGPGKDLPFETLLVDPATRAVFEKLWGKAGPLVKNVPAARLVDRAWQARSAWSIVPFEQLEPRWKVIAVDGQSPVQKAFDAQHYGLAVRFGLVGDDAALSRLSFNGPIAVSNRDPNRLTTVMLTGVTALVRGTASLMEGRGLTYPARDIGDWLREADILHINNEVPFASNCPPPFNWPDLVFCSRPKYIELLREIGTDVVELSGDHFADWGPEAMLYTLDLYRQEGWPYYGGGANLEEARQPVLFEHNGNKIAFIGCNAKEPGYATAREDQPGAAHCDFDRLSADIQSLRQQGYLPVVTYQHLEYYQYVALPYLQVDFHLAADAGGAIVSGSQAHQPHAFEFRKGAFLHYGLGNLFFDQTNQGDPPRTAFIDRHVIYNGRHISTELLTIFFVDYARSRPMTAEERQALLKAVFQASGW